MVEISMVIALTILVAIVGIPAIQGYLIESKVPHVAEDLQRLIARMKVAAITNQGAPYGHVGQRALVNNLRNAVAVRISSDELTVAHGLGGAGLGKSGVITLAPATVPGEADGSAFSLLLTNVNHAACPTLATILQRLASRVLMSSKDSLVEVKNSTGSPVKAYDPILADSLCLEGDVNTFEFVFN